MLKRTEVNIATGAQTDVLQRAYSVPGGAVVVLDEGATLPDGAVELSDAEVQELRTFVPPPAVVSMRQARLALLGAGHLAAVGVAIAALPSPQKEAAQIEWEYAVEVRRDSALVAMLSGALGLDAAALDQLFTAAGGL